VGTTPVAPPTRRLRPRLRTAAPLIATIIALSLGLWLAGRPRRPHSSPFPLESEGVLDNANVRDGEGRLVFVNFRTVEPGVLYRGAAFPRNARVVREGTPVDVPAAFVDQQAFEFLRAKNVRTVVALFEKESEFYEEEGYFRFYSEQTGSRISVVWVPVPLASAYAREESSGLRAGAELIVLMKRRRPEDGAVFVHGESGRDATGVAVAAYELWKNWGWAERETLWNQVLSRYLVSNRILLDVPELGIEKAACDSRPPSFVCPEWLAALRRDLERIAQL
jgi:hypothetical protein